ncbi:hypothetical protein DYH55_16315 [Methylovirgula sp. 4M-Z18]|nr:hypothetical protein DYH55_16315 [Methylovirgula sp. 4M-Z18]
MPENKAVLASVEAVATSVAVDKLKAWKGASQCRDTTAQFLAAKGHVKGQQSRDGSPNVARAWPRQINPGLDNGDPGTNLLGDIADMLTKPDLLTERDKEFLRHVQEATIRTHRDGSSSAYLSERHYGKLLLMVGRFTKPHVQWKFLKRRDQLAAQLASNAQQSPQMTSLVRSAVPWASPKEQPVAATQAQHETVRAHDEEQCRVAPSGQAPKVYQAETPQPDTAHHDPVTGRVKWLLPTWYGRVQ